MASVCSISLFSITFGVGTRRQVSRVASGSIEELVVELSLPAVLWTTPCDLTIVHTIYQYFVLIYTVILLVLSFIDSCRQI